MPDIGNDTGVFSISISVFGGILIVVIGIFCLLFSTLSLFSFIMYYLEVFYGIAVFCNGINLFEKRKVEEATEIAEKL